MGCTAQRAPPLLQGSGQPLAPGLSAGTSCLHHVRPSVPSTRPRALSPAACGPALLPPSLLGRPPAARCSQDELTLKTDLSIPSPAHDIVSAFTAPYAVPPTPAPVTPRARAHRCFNTSPSPCAGGPSKGTASRWIWLRVLKGAVSPSPCTSHCPRPDQHCP